MTLNLPSPRELATVRTSDGAVSFQLTPDDVLWSARAAAREDKDNPAPVLWTFTQRGVLFKLLHSVPYLTTLQGFSQPINPAWRRDGKFCKPGGPYYGKPECSEDKLAARDWFANATWDQLQARYPKVVATTLQWARGELPNPIPGVTNFSAGSVAQHYLTNTPGARLYAKQGNWYIIDSAAVKWPENYAQMVSASGAIAPIAPMQSAGLFASVFRGVTDWWRG
jgi:hypothetical protein